jgi:hypothetical protein
LKKFKVEKSVHERAGFMETYRAFFFGLFNKSEERRREILQHWHRNYPVNKKAHGRLAHVFEEFIAGILYEPIAFKLYHDQFCFFAKGSPALAVRFEWLTDEERKFIIYTVFAERRTTFRSCNVYDNLHLRLDEFIYNPKDLSRAESHTAICSIIWQRELVRDFVWLIKSQRNAHYMHELNAALMSLMHQSQWGRKDVFLATLYYNMQGNGCLEQVPCWGLSATDLHPEDAYQRQIPNRIDESMAIRDNLY